MYYYEEMVRDVIYEQQNSHRASELDCDIALLWSWMFELYKW